MPRIPSACIVKQFWPHLQRFNIISTFALEMLDLLSNRRCTTVSASHTATLMEASQRVVILQKNELWPTKAGTVGETLDASLMFSLQSQACVISLQPHSVHCTSPCEFVKNICQNEPNPNQCVKPPTAMETKWAKRAWRKLAYKLVLCGLWYL